MTTTDLDMVVERERMLLDPAVRANADEVTDLLHPDFLEFGKSGRVWNRETIVVSMTNSPSVDGLASEFIPTQLADDVVLLTYRGADGTRRGSIWLRDPTVGWVLRFHQGTPTT